MISEREKQTAWRVLWFRLDEMREQLEISQEQVDYLRSQLLRKAFPGEDAKKVRARLRSCSLARAVCIEKARDRRAGNETLLADVFGRVAKHYGVRESRVKRSYYDDRHWIEGPITIALPDGTTHTDPPLSEEWLAEQPLPHICFDKFAPSE